jgi:hypothetical protein
MDSADLPHDPHDPHDAARTGSIDPLATAQLGAGAPPPGPGQSAGSVLRWVLRRAAPAEWSPLRPAEELVAQVHPDDPVLRGHVLRQARSRLVALADRTSTSRQQRALATLTVAINLIDQQSDGHAGAEGDHGVPPRASSTRQALIDAQRPLGGERYPADPSYFIG